MANYTSQENKGIWAVPLEITDFNILVALLGGFISVFGLVSYLLKETFYLSEAREYLFVCHFEPFTPLLLSERRLIVLGL